MTPGHGAEHLMRMGMDPLDAMSRASLMEGVERACCAAMPGPPEWRAFVPGRIEVFGKHTDYAGGRALLTAVPRGFAVAARARQDSCVRVVDARYGQIVEVDVAAEGARPKGFGAYVDVVARRLALNFPGASLGVDTVLASDLPRAAGVSSSSALVVGIAWAIIRRGRLQDRPEWRAHIGSLQDLAWYLGCVENGLDYPGLTGSSGVGTLGGSEDHTAILTCRAGFLSQYRFVPVTHLGDTPMPGHWTFVVASSGVQADKAGSVRDRYNRASLGTRALLDLWNARAAAPSPSLGAALSSEVGAMGQLEAWVSESGAAGFSPADLRDRLHHFAREDGRADRAAAAFAGADRDALRTLAAESQHEADHLLGNQVPETRSLVAAAVEAGAVGASSFGAGFGGSAWALVDALTAERFADEWIRAYRTREPTITDVEWFVARPGPALTELSETAFSV